MSNSSRQIIRSLSDAINMPKSFPACSVPISVVADVMEKDATFVREGIELGWLPIGFCRKNGKRRNFYISPKLLWEVTGYLYDPAENCVERSVTLK